MASSWQPEATGLYLPGFEHDACGIGVIADIKGRASHNIVKNAVNVLVNLTHRGAVGSDPDTGDGAGLLMQIPDGFFRNRQKSLGFKLPDAGQYAVGVFFLTPEKSGECREMFEQVASEEGCPVLGWRDVPTNPQVLGATARENCPAVTQAFLKNPGISKIDFERKLYLIRRIAENRAKERFRNFYIPSLSARTLIYKGLLVAHQVMKFYPDLSEEDIQSAIAVVHQRYSTNTFPSWPLAQPFRFIGHNGEINTLRGNINKMMARRKSLSSEIWKTDIEKLMPIIMEGGSDSACFDNMLEFLVLSGRSLPHAILMMIPEAWGDKYYMGHDRRGFYEYHAAFMEPWDGPAAMAFTDGTQVGCILDRNGLRPARYLVTDDDLFVLGSETGVLDVDPANIRSKGRVLPGKMVLVDTAKGRVVQNDEIKAEVCRSRPYRRWLTANRLSVEDFGAMGEVGCDVETLHARQLAFGYTREDIDLIIHPMAVDGSEPVGSMGNDTPLAVLSDQPQLLFNYFKQHFAQVTNPPIDPIREDLVMSLTTYLGRERNILEERPENARRLKLYTPILTNANIRRIKRSTTEGLQSATLDSLFDITLGEHGLAGAMEALCLEAESAVADGRSIIILSDRHVSEYRAPIPSLLAISGVHQHLVQRGIRNRVGLVLESGEPREVNHFAELLSFGADAINPYLAIESVAKLHEDGAFAANLSMHDALENYIKAVNKGILKILSKMGISTLRSYHGAQVYEALGLGREFVRRYFTNTVSRIGGIGIEHIARETMARHHEAFGLHRGRLPLLPVGGVYAYRRDGERRMWTPEAIHFLQQATRRNDVGLYRKFSDNINNQENRHITLRSLLDFDFAKCEPVPLAEVESVEEIVKRFVTGAMSFGSLSPEAHETMAIAMNRIGAMSNSGEGGEDASRYQPRANGDSVNSATKQVASGRFGVTIEYLSNARDIQIKVAQGAKPGEGGQLPGHKVNEVIARVRHSTPGVSLISPPPHHDIYSIEDLAQLIFDLKNANPAARVSVKLVSESGVGTIAAGVAKGKADMVLISGGDGGTGASPWSSIKHAGLPFELGLAETHQTLLLNGLRDRIRVQTDGQMRTGRDVAIAALLGAEEFGFGTSALVTIGCVMMRKCHLNTCPVGVATQDPKCRARFTGKPEYLISYLHFVAAELREIMASLGCRKVEELVGRADLLKKRDNVSHWKASTLDFGDLLKSIPCEGAAHCVRSQEHALAGALDQTLIVDCAPAIDKKKKVDKAYRIRNVNRTVGTMLAGEITRRLGAAGLPEDTITLRFTGTAGQSFGALATHGMTLILEGDANDYVGKSLSGGKIIVKPNPAVKFDAAENVIVGNTLLYGATEGEAYFCGLAGERFCVRNSGATAVVEGVGDHGCEYMTGGLVAVLGDTGVNFAAGMSGGIAYVYDPRQDFDLRCNLGMIDLEQVIAPADIAQLRGLIGKHLQYTGSKRAQWMLDNWDMALRLFVKVMPVEYRRALGLLAKVEVGARRTEAETVDQA
jgi:glutamate synthase domain-containing protein 2/glutamate synthase domain-containing protein 1/glutamate synthase domain-containing protein 3